MCSEFGGSPGVLGNPKRVCAEEGGRSEPWEDSGEGRGRGLWIPAGGRLPLEGGVEPAVDGEETGWGWIPWVLEKPCPVARTFPQGS